MNSTAAARARPSEMADPYTCPLSHASDPTNVGGKAYNLSRMLQLGIEVPTAYVVTTRAFDDFLDETRLRTPITALCAGLSAREPEHIREMSEKIRHLIMGTRIPDGIFERVVAMRKEILPQVTLIVRSSAVGEDSQSASFAGQMESHPDVNSMEELEKALLACWASYWSQRALSYQLARGLELKGMGLLVQQLVCSKISGVLFTEVPNGQPGAVGKLLVEYCKGRGDALVSGQINPGRFTITRTDFEWYEESRSELPIPALEDLLLNPSRISELVSQALRLEKSFGAPQDIEWTLDSDGRLYFVQSRPITVQAHATRSKPPAGHKDPTAHSEPTVLWSNANVSENFPDPISPLLYSIASAGYYHYFRNLARAFGIPSHRIRTVEHPLRQIIGVHGARMYYNLTNIHQVLRIAPFGDRLSRYFDQFVGTSPTPAEQSGSTASRLKGLAQIAELAVIGMKIAWQYFFLPRRIKTFEATIDHFSQHTTPALLQRRSLLELLDDLRGFLDIRFNRWTNAALADAAAMVCNGVLGELLKRFFPTSDYAGMHNKLLTGLPDIVSSGPVLGLWKLSRRIRSDVALTSLFASTQSQEILTVLQEKEEFAAFREELNEFLESWGFRCPGELMLVVPSLQENPVALLDILKTYVTVEKQSPIDVMKQQAEARLTETTRIIKELSGNRVCRFVPGFKPSHLFRLILCWTQRSISLRERARLKQALLYSRCRQIVLAIGKRLVLEERIGKVDDIFFLSFQEIDALLSGAEMLPTSVKALVSLREAEHTRLSQTVPPDRIRLPEGDYFSQRTDTDAKPEGEEVLGNPSELWGMGACPGVVTSRATILQDISDTHRLCSGDILVTRQTDPGWAPVFFLISGLIIERGGMLSHGAIIAREFGIPSVVGVSGATKQIRQGQTVTVHGDEGRVEIH